MENISITDIVAVIGCITGCASLLINFYKVIAEKGKIHIKTNYFHNVYFDKLKESKFLTRYQAIIYIEIVNSTPHPLTIYDLDIRMKDGHYSPDKCPVNEITLSCKQIGATVMTHEDMSNALQIPYTIPPFEVYMGNIFLVNFPDKPSKNELFYMRIKTTHKTKRLFGAIKQHKKEHNQYE